MTDTQVGSCTVSQAGSAIKIKLTRPEYGYAVPTNVLKSTTH